MNCWIDPDGNIFPVEFHTHGKFANNILEMSLPSEQAIIALVSRGWLHVGLTPFVSTTPYRDLSDRQAAAFFTVLAQVDGLFKQNLLGFLYA